MLVDQLMGMETAFTASGTDLEVKRSGRSEGCCRASEAGEPWSQNGMANLLQRGRIRGCSGILRRR